MPDGAVFLLAAVVAVIAACAALASALDVRRIADVIVDGYDEPPEATTVNVAAVGGDVVVDVACRRTLLVRVVLTPRDAAELADVLLAKGYDAAKSGKGSEPETAAP